MTSKRKSSSSPSDLFRRDLLALIPQLRAFARSLCNHRELAEDMAQGTLVKAWQAHTAFRPGTNLRAWLFTILRNEFYTYRRRSWRQSHWDEIKGGRIATPAEPQHWALELSDATRGLHELPDGQRESLILVAAAGFSYEEAAEICGVPVGTVKSRVARGRPGAGRHARRRAKIPEAVPSDGFLERHSGATRCPHACWRALRCVCVIWV